MQKRQTWHLKESTSHSTATALLGALFWSALSLLPVREANAQGTVIFNQQNSLGTTHVWANWPFYSNPYVSLVGFGSNDSPSGTTPYSAAGQALIGAGGRYGHYGYATTFAQLLAANGAGQPESSLVPSGQTTTFKTGASLGCIAMITDTLNNIPPDSPAATLEMVAWDDSSGLYPTWLEASVGWMAGLIDAGKSGAFTVLSIGGNWNTPPSFLPMSFNLYGGFVPEPSTLALAGLGAAVMLVFRRRK
jgi:hypothetical protein